LIVLDSLVIVRKKIQIQVGKTESPEVRKWIQLLVGKYPQPRRGWIIVSPSATRGRKSRESEI